MLLFSSFLLTVGLFETSVAFHSFTGSRDVFHADPGPTPKTRTPRDSMLLNRIKLFPLSRQLWKNNGFDAVSTNESGSGPAYPDVYVCWKDNEDDCLEACQTATREGKPSFVIDFFKRIIETLKVFHPSYFYVLSPKQHSKGKKKYPSGAYVIHTHFMS